MQLAVGFKEGGSGSGAALGAGWNGKEKERGLTTELELGRDYSHGQVGTLLFLQALRAPCVSEMWTTALRTPATTGAVSTASLASHVLVPQATRAHAVRARWMSVAANPAATVANA